MSGYTEKARVPAFDGKPESFDRWEIQWNAFAEVEGISDALGDALSADMPATAATVLTEA